MEAYRKDMGIEFIDIWNQSKSDNVRELSLFRHNYSILLDHNHVRP